MGRLNFRLSEPSRLAASVEAALDALDPDALSPRDALDALYQLKKLKSKP